MRTKSGTEVTASFCMTRPASGCKTFRSRLLYNQLAMPQFSATLLGLLGISAGTYVGFKIPESDKKKEST
jgi:hypothetical protein